MKSVGMGRLRPRDGCTMWFVLLPILPLTCRVAVPDFVALTLPQNSARVPTMRAPIQLHPLWVRPEVRTPVGIFPLALLSVKVEVIQPRSQLVFLILLRRRRWLVMLVSCGTFDYLIQPLNDRSPFLEARSVVVQNRPGGQDREGLLVRYASKLQKLSCQFPLLENRLEFAKI